MPRTTRALVAGFDAVVMTVAAYSETGDRFGQSLGDLVLWGSAAAAALCVLVVLQDGSPLLAWAAVGYVLFGGLLTRGSPHWLLVGLAVALMPLVPRPRGSVGIGLAVAGIVAIGTRIVLESLL